MKQRHVRALKIIMNNNKALVPKLRFLEFRDTEKWAIEPMKKLFMFGNGKDHKHLTNGDIPVYGSGGYMRSVNEYLYDGESVCIGRKGTIDNPIFLSGKFWTVDTLFYTHSFKCCLPKFIYLIFQNIDWRSHNEAGGIPSLSKANIEKIEIAIPDLSEQQKIADCLSSLDELITAHTQKHQALQLHKKGLMQNLFPAEGETVPALRFPEFRDAWNTSKLKKYIDLLSGYAFKSEYFSASGKKLLTPKNFNKNGFANFSEENTKFTTEKYDSKYICTEGDLLLLLTDLSPSCELLGKPIFLIKKDDEVLLNQRIVKVIPNQKLNNKFLHYFFLTDYYSTHIRNTASGSTVRHSSNKIVLDTDISFPSFVEQQKIADCLSSLDDLITAQAKKIESLKAHKKGLMQQLFPAVDESNINTQAEVNT